MMNKKGFTTVELIVAFVLTSVIVFFLFQIVLLLKDVLFLTNQKSRMLAKQIVLVEMIYNDLNSDVYELIIGSSCKGYAIASGNWTDCVQFTFRDTRITDPNNERYTVTRRLRYNRENDTIGYGNYVTDLVGGSRFGNINITSEVLLGNAEENTLNSLLRINIPILHDSFPGEDFGININYLYDNTVALSGLNITDHVIAEASDFQIHLINPETIVVHNSTFRDPGFQITNRDGAVVTGNVDVRVSAPIGGTFTVRNPDELNDRTLIPTSEAGRTFSITYTIRNPGSNEIVTQAIRSITVVRSVDVFTFTGDRQEFTAPVTGRYEIELWGASGGGTTIMKGRGGYTTGTIQLERGQLINIFVGGEGTTSTNTGAAAGGWNGGGASGDSTGSTLRASSGGGATDIRFGGTALTDRIMIAGGGGGGGSRNDSMGICSGGPAGATTRTAGGVFSTTFIGDGRHDGGCDPAYVGFGATHNAGGRAGDAVSVTAPTGGVIGNGGSGGVCIIAGNRIVGGGGGGGWFGGGGGTCYGGGGSGTGFCQYHNASGSIVRPTSCIVHSGESTFRSATTNGMEQGNIGNGQVRITLREVITVNTP